MNNEEEGWILYLHSKGRREPEPAEVVSKSLSYSVVQVQRKERNGG